MAYVIDKQLCSGCDACSIVCPTNAISHDAKAEKRSGPAALFRNAK